MKEEEMTKNTSTKKKKKYSLTYWPSTLSITQNYAGTIPYASGKGESSESTETLQQITVSQTKETQQLGRVIMGLKSRWRDPLRPTWKNNWSGEGLQISTLYRKNTNTEIQNNNNEKNEAETN